MACQPQFLEQDFFNQIVQQQMMQQQQINHMLQLQQQSDFTYLHQVNPITQINPISTSSSLTPLCQNTMTLPASQAEALSLTVSRPSDTCMQASLSNYDQDVTKFTNIDTVKNCTDITSIAAEAASSVLKKSAEQTAEQMLNSNTDTVKLCNSSPTANTNGDIFTEHKVIKVEAEDGSTESNGPKSVFVCSICDKMFTRRSGRDRHYKKHGQTAPESDCVERRTANPYRPKCEDCGKDFARADHLRRHVLIHTGLRPHVCSVCSQTFTRKDKMTAHMRRHSLELIQLSQLTS